MAYLQREGGHIERERRMDRVKKMEEE